VAEDRRKSLRMGVDHSLDPAISERPGTEVEEKPDFQAGELQLGVELAKWASTNRSTVFASTTTLSSNDQIHDVGIWHTEVSQVMSRRTSRWAAVALC